MGFLSPIIVWHFDTGNVVAKYDSHKVRVEAMAFTECENYLLSLGGLDDGAVMVYDIVRQEVVCVGSSVKSTSGIAAVLLSSNLRSQQFITAGDNMLRLWTLNKEQRTVTALDTSFGKIKRKILCVVINRLDEYAYCGTSTGDLLKIKLNYASENTTNTPTTAPSLVICFAKHPVSGTSKRWNAAELYCQGVTALNLIEDDCDTMIVGSGNGIVELVTQQQRHPNNHQSIRECEKLSKGWEAKNLSTPTQPLLETLKSAYVETAVTSIQMMKKKVRISMYLITISPLI